MADDLTRVTEESARGGFYLITGTASATIIMAAASIIIARLLGPELYGQYALALVTPQLLLLFADLGINQGIIKFTATFRVKNENHRIKRIIKYGLMLRTTAGTLIFLLNYLLADFFAAALLQRPELAIYIKIAAISVLFQAIFTTITSAFVGLDKTEYNALASNVQAIAKAATSLSLVLLGCGVIGAITGHVASYALAAIPSLAILIITTRENKDYPKHKSDKITSDLKTILNYGIPLYISALFAGFIPIYQNIILALFTTDADIGNYKAAVNFISLINIVTVPITTALLPAFSKLDFSNNKMIKTFYQMANKYISMVIIPLAFLIMMLSKEIVETIYGHAYESAPLFLTIYCPIYFLVGLGYLILPSLYNGVGDTKTTLKMSLITFSALIFLSPALTLAYNVPGLISAFIIATAYGNLYGLFTAKRRYNISIQTHIMLKVYLNSVTSAVPLLMISQFTQLPPLLKVMAKGSLYLFTYATLLPITKTVKRFEIESATSLIRKIQLLKIVQPLLTYQKRILRFLEGF